MTRHRTLAFNKPYGVLSCFTDAEGRPTLADFIRVPDVYGAGRLDYDSEGLLLLTSDGELAHRITDPRHKFLKVYAAQVEHVPKEESLAWYLRPASLAIVVLLGTLLLNFIFW